MTESSHFKVRDEGILKGVLMKKLLFVMSILTLMSYGCNRNEEKGSDVDAGMQQEEINRTDRGDNLNSPDSMGSDPERGTMSGENADPAVEESDMSPGNTQQ